MSLQEDGSLVMFEGLAGRHFDSALRQWIEQHRLAPGRLGGKTLGLLLAWQILQMELPVELRAKIHLPASYFVGSSEFTNFLGHPSIAQYLDGLVLEKGNVDYVDLNSTFKNAPLSKETSNNLRKMLREVDGVPIIVRSSSVLEDQYGSSFAGIYRSVFCSNQGGIEARHQEIELAIKEVFASAFSPDAFSYRKQKGYSQSAEEMAVLIQIVDGQKYEDFYFPVGSGIAFSYNPYCWTERLNAQDGFLRLVWGLGTQAVQTTAGEYPRLIGLSNPRLRPEVDAHDVFYYSQHHIGVINTARGQYETLPVDQLLKSAYPELKYIASVLRDDSIRELISKPQAQDQLVITFDRLCDQTGFIDLIRRSVGTLAEKLGHVVNIEFALSLSADGDVTMGLLQCRRVAWDEAVDETPLVADPGNLLIRTDQFLYSGIKKGIKFLVVIDPDCYHGDLDPEQQKDMARMIREINQKMDVGYMLVGPGRWGSTRPELGIPVRFSDIYNAKALIEIHGRTESILSATYGTHFFMDLVEAQIALLAVGPGSARTLIEDCDLKATRLPLTEFVQDLSVASECIRVYCFPDGHELCLAASPKKGVAFVYIAGDH